MPPALEITNRLRRTSMHEKEQRTFGITNKSFRTCLFGVLVAAGALLSLLAALSALWWGLLYFGGPYSDMDIRTDNMEPFDGITVSMANGTTIAWDVDSRFAFESDDGGAIGLETKLEDLPSNWRVREYVNALASSSGVKEYFVCDTLGSKQESFVLLRVNEDTGNTVSVLVFCGIKKDLRLVHLQSSRSISIYHPKRDDLRRFFESCK